MMDLPSGWYAFASPRDLRSRKPHRVRRFGENWVVRRTTTRQWIAQLDRCPHRGARLSSGKVKDDCLECPFHGFRFDSQGNCVHVPEIQRDAPGLKLTTYSLVEKHDFLWIGWGNPVSTEIPWFSELSEAEYTFASARQIWKTHFTRCVESQLDYAHLPFVHSNTIGRGFNPALQVTWKLNDESLRAYLGPEGPSTGYFEFRYPNVWELVVSSKFVQTLMFVPVDENETWIYARAYHRFTRIPILRDWIAWISARIANPYILSQDKRIVLSQEPGDVRAAHEERLFPSDRAIQAFRKRLGKRP